MFESETFGPEVLGNPSILQYKFLTEMSNRSIGGTASVGSANNGFCVLLDGMCDITSQFTKMIDKRFQGMYPVRSVTERDFYPHLSDFDYVNMEASPASMQFEMVLDKAWLIANAVSYNDTYSKLVIPDTSAIVIGTHTFGLYYPIEFLINKNNNVITTNYDISSPNPLMSFSTNQLAMAVEYTTDGVTYLRIVFDAYQFSRTRKSFTVDDENGFSQTFAYSDKFYAARVYSLLNNVWTELTYSPSQMVYDPETATAILTPMSDTATVRVDIPQVYFTNGLIGSSIRVDLYTTEGAISTTVTQTDVDNMQIAFDTSASIYAAPLGQPTYLYIIPYNTTVISGGSDPLDFATTRSQLLSGAIYGDTPVFPAQLDAEVQKYGFRSQKLLDNVTNRIYSAGAALTFSDGTQVPTITSNVIMDSTNMAGDPSTILEFSDSLLTILPTTVFEYDQSTGTSTPLTDAQISAMSELAQDDLINTLNGAMYTRQPFHVVLSYASKYPQAKAFNLMSPSMNSLVFVRENANSAARLTVADVSITHLANGTGGYQIKLAVQTTDALTTVDKSDQRIFMTMTNKSGIQVYVEATYLNSNSSYDVYSAVLSTDYHISTDGYFRTTLPNSDGVNTDCDIPLSANFTILGCAAITSFPTVVQDATLLSALPSTLRSTWLVTSQQTVTITFGEDLSTIMYNPVNTTWGAQVYATYPMNIYRTYEADQYLIGTDGTIATRVTTNSAGKSVLEVVKTRDATDYVLTGKNIVLTITQTQKVPTATIAVDDVSAVLIGYSAMGLNIGVGATVIAVDKTNSTITLSSVPNAVTAGEQINLVNAITNTTVLTTQSAASDQLVLTDVDSIIPGMSIMGFDIETGTTIVSINPSVKTVTLSQTTSAAISAGAVVEVFNPAGPYTVLHAAGAVMLDSSNNPIEKVSTGNIFGITMSQFDARLFASDDTTDTAYVASLPTEITTMAHKLDPVRAKLIEETSLYYRPYRTMGTASFGVGNGITKTLPLQQSYTITMYVSKAVKDNTALCDQIKTEAIATLADYVQSNTVVSTSAIAELLTDEFSTNVITLDVSGIYRDDSYYTLALLDGDVAMSLASVLTSSTTGQLSLDPDVTINFVLDPSDTTSTS